MYRLANKLVPPVFSSISAPEQCSDQYIPMNIPILFRWREWCGLHPMNTWEDLHGVMTNKSVKEYASIYDSPEDMDLWTAGVTEKPLPGKRFNCQYSSLVSGISGFPSDILKL